MIFILEVPFAPFAVAIARFATVEVSVEVDLESCFGAIDLRATKARIASSKTAAAVLNEKAEPDFGFVDDLSSFLDIK